MSIRLVTLSGLLILSAVLIATLFIRNHPAEYYDRTEFLMGTYVTVVISSENVSPVKLAAAAFQELRRVEDKYAKDYGTEVMKLNSAEVGELVPVDDETAHIIETALAVARISDGGFDFTLGRVMNLWGFNKADTEKGVPDDDQLKEALRSTGYEYVRLVDDGGWFVKKLRELTIDLSAIAKGYAVDSAISVIRALDGDATGYVDAGGDIGIIGPKYGKLPWTIGVRHPRSERADEVFDVVYLYDGAIATSGDYENYFIEDGMRYHHIIDPSTGYPAVSGAISVTIVSSSVMLADAFATAAVVLGKSPGITFFPRNGALVMMILEDLSIFKSEGFEVYQAR